jgi:DegV family protein with EDD domain
MINKKVAILVDSCSDVPASIINKDFFEMIPMEVFFGKEEYQDRVNIEPDVFYEKLKTADPLPTTSSPKGELISQALNNLIKKGYEQVVAVCISSGLSGTAQQVKIYAKEFPELQIEVIDTKNIGIASGFAAVKASELIESGLEFDKIVAEVNRVANQTRVFFYVPSLKYLIAGGRIGRVAGLVGSIINLKPIISCDDEGIYYPVAKARGEKKAIKKMLQLVDETIGDAKNFNLAVVHGLNEPLMNEISTEFKNKYPTMGHFFNGDISPALGVHTGPGLIGIGVQITD